MSFVVTMFMMKNMKSTPVIMQFKKATCPYFSYGDEYKLARKQ